MSASGALGELQGSMIARLVVFAVLLVALTASLVGSLAYRRASRALEREALLRLRLSAESVADRFTRDVAERVEEVERWSRPGDLWSRPDDERSRTDQGRDDRSAGGRLAAVIARAGEPRGPYRAIVGFDRAGREAGGAGPERGRVKPPARSGRTTLDVLYEGDAGAGRLRIEAPVADTDRPGAPLGTIVVLVDPLPLLRRENTRPRAVRARERLTLRGEGGRTIATIDVSAPRSGPDHRAPSGQGVPQASSSAPSGSEAEWLTGTADVAAPSGVDAPPLVIVVGESTALALGSVRKLPAKFVKIALMSLLVASAFGAFLAWRISAPVRGLTAAVRRVGERGRLDTPPELPRAGGEVGVLSRAFGAMMESVAAAQAEAVVHSRLALLGEVAAHVAHDVRTPLSVIKTSAHLLTRPEVDAAERQDLARSIAEEVDRLNRVVTGLLEASKPGSAPPRPLAIAPLLDRAVRFFRPLAEKSGIRIDLADGDRGALVHGSEDRLYQVFLNLIHNALQAARGPGVVSVRALGERRSLVIEIADDGPGLAPEIASRLFSPYVTTKAQGAGLGLAMSRRIIEEHGGTIEGENAPGRGALFRIRLPRVEDPEGGA